MTNKEQIRQNDGARQGNIHTDSDTGNNETGHSGSTLDQGDNSRQVVERQADEADPERESPSQDGKAGPDTLGIP